MSTLRPILVAIGLLLCFGSPALHAFGFNDYKLEIGDGYSINRGSRMFFEYDREPQMHISAPVFSGYQVLRNHILLRAETSGKEQPKRISYYIVTKRSTKAIGPLSEAAFEQQKERLGISETHWEIPRHPNPTQRNLDAIAFMLIMLLLIAVPPLVFFSVLALIFVGIRKLRRGRQNPYHPC